MIARWLSAILLVCLALPASAQKQEILVFAAASLSDALTEIGKVYEAGGGGKVRFNFAGSNDLARQIAAGDLPVGIVYATDAASTDKVRVVYQVPAEATPDLRYFAAPVAPGSPAATPFVAFLKGPKARAIFARYGFTPGG